MTPLIQHKADNSNLIPGLEYAVGLLEVTQEMEGIDKPTIERVNRMIRYAIATVRAK